MVRRKRELREESILWHFQNLIEERGFFDLKVSELAKRASISVGTLYSHFPCKEDLLLSLSFQSKFSRAEFVRSALERATMPDQRFFVGIIALWRSYQVQRSLTELEFLAMTPSIWKRASPRFQAANANLRRELFGLFKDLLRDAFKEELPSVTKSQIEIGHRSLMLGMDVMSFSEFKPIQSIFKPKQWEKCMLKNMSCLLVGWGCSKEKVDVMIESGLEIVNQMDDIQIKFQRLT
jgi:AcrR family transcriptional regulator